MKTIKEKNRMIAEFMGYEFKLVKNPTICVDGVSHIDDVAAVIDGRLVFTNNLKYHISWDWLMPVVEKIESIIFNEDNSFNVTIGATNYCVIQDSNGEVYDSVEDYGNSKLETVYSAVVKFIEWYNENK